MRKPERQAKPATPPPERKEERKERRPKEEQRSAELAVDPKGPPVNEEYGQHKNRKKAETSPTPRTRRNP
jgi:hypothetical protein